MIVVCDEHPAFDQDIVIDSDRVDSGNMARIVYLHPLTNLDTTGSVQDVNSIEISAGEASAERDPTPSTDENRKPHQSRPRKKKAGREQANGDPHPVRRTVYQKVPQESIGAHN
jgi:hypothetical protein